MCLTVTEYKRFRRWLDFDVIWCSRCVRQCPATGALHKGVNEVMPVVTALQRHVTAEYACRVGRSAGAVTAGANEILRVFCTFFSGLATVWYM